MSPRNRLTPPPDLSADASYLAGYMEALLGRFDEFAIDLKDLQEWKSEITPKIEALTAAAQQEASAKALVNADRQAWYRLVWDKAGNLFVAVGASAATVTLSHLPHP